MKAAETHALAVKLGTAVTALIALINDATKQGNVDEVSDQSGYGIPGGVGDDILEAYNLAILASNKINSVLTTRQTLL